MRGLTIAASILTAGAYSGPRLHEQAMVKMMQNKKNVRIRVFWDAVPRAEGYEICHNCNIKNDEVCIVFIN